MSENKQNSEKQSQKHLLHLTDRETLELFGVISVENFDNLSVLFCTNLGDLLVSGEDLHISHLHLEEEEAVVKGQINSLEYKRGRKEQKARNKNFLSRVLK